MAFYVMRLPLKVEMKTLTKENVYKKIAPFLEIESFN